MTMSPIGKIVAIVLAIAIVGLSVAYVGARYLISKLDGTGGVSAPQQEQQSSATTTSATPGFVDYSSDHTGLAFKYPEAYELTTRHDEYNGTEIHVLVLVPRGVTVPDMSEGPPAISIIELPTSEPLDLWIKDTSISNYNLSPDKKLTPTMVDGAAGFSYKHTGLYESDAVAVEANDKTYLFSVGYNAPTDKIRTDFQDLIKTVQFIHD